MTPAPGTRFGPYEILAPLGAGGMGEVYRARDTRLGREVAIKVLPADVANDAERARRFEVEARAASTLNHPNILTVHDIGIEQGRAFLVTELLHGETLRDALMRGAMAPARVASIAKQVSSGLAAAHHAGIVHRDLKPENLFITRDGICKILDFGLARVDRPELDSVTGSNTPTAGATMAGAVMGTAGYMAPEQVRGQRADARSDLFSLGVVMHEMLAGQSPFQRESVVESLHAILKEEPGTPLPPGPIAPIVQRCLEKDPARRFQSASDLAFALGNLSDVTQPGAAPGRRSRRAMMAGLLAIGVLVVATLALLRARDRESTSASAASVRSLGVMPFTSLSQQESDEYFSAGMTDALTTELSRIGAMKIIGRGSTARFHDATKTPREIAQELGVEGLVSGSVLRDGDRVRISAQLTEAATDRVLWAENYERPLSDVLALQGEVTRAIADAIALELSPAEERRLSAAVPVDSRAIDQYLRGRYLWSQRTEQSVRGALEHFRASAEIAPDFALAHLGIADSYMILGAYNYEQPTQSMPFALEALDRAMALDSTSGEVHATRGDIAFHFERRYEDALGHADRAVALTPNYSAAHTWRAEVLVTLGRTDEAIEELKRAIALDAVTPFPRFMLGMARALKGDVTQAEEDFRVALQVAPGFVLGGEYVRMMIRQGRHQDAIALARELEAAAPNVTNIVTLGVALAMAGDPEGARASRDRLRAMASERWVSPLEFSCLEAALGNREAALRHLREGIDAREFRIPLYLSFPPAEFDSLKNDPAFKRLMELIRTPA